ncbi:glycoside hydrolase family 15 protein [Paeniglutamicibacter antarcticus]|uniref:Glycoside hydrolase family 15 protein n=1 Tax=Arthrobacter terrae TaxID=2935737 RepID=A0A931G654_9MICC|nr:glycoside hydrolase family 15 protein [Arthrobacter terrae]MBG0737954.1 glycoside hydrolase family 15 protein [Arthrobacter terrae]
MVSTKESWQFPPHVLREYALIADGERGIIVGPRGDFVWMCVPRWDSDAVFSSLIGGHGSYAITPQGRFVWGGYYEEGTLIWRSRWVTESGIIECREALAFPAEPGRAVILRRVMAVEGDAKVRVILDPRAGFGHHGVRSLARENGIWTGRTGSLRMRWMGADDARPSAGGTGPALSLDLTLKAGEHHDFVLELSEEALPDELVVPDTAWEATESAWRSTVPDLAETIAPRDARHAYAVLRGLTSTGGGMVAAATMSLPEHAKQGRNYDYRYVWIRDQCFTGEAIAAAGAHPLLDDAVRFVSERLLADGPNLKPAYTTLGGPVPGQRSLKLAGYPGGSDILGNHVNAQFQLDALGESLLLLAAAGRHDHLDADGWRAAEAAAAAIAIRWHDPEAGIWELDNKNWTESRLICVAGLRAISSVGAPRARMGDWLALAEAILAETAAGSTHPSGRWQRAPDDERNDSALLFPPIRGGVAADDPRTLATLRALEEELGVDSYLYRFRQGPGPLADAEGAFLLCGFTMALAQHQQGNEVEATRWFERNRASCGPPGLFTEEFDVNERQLRGNLPQAFVHALMLECSARLARPWGA